MLESVAYIGLGLGRAAIGAIRTQIDLLLGFTYFYDHPYEWNSVKTTGKGFKLRSDIDKHHKDTRKKFASDIDKIEHSEGRSLLSLYRILSAHIHGQSRLTVPKAGRFVELISSDSFSDSLITLQMQVSISISNYLTAVFLSEGIDPPREIRRVDFIRFLFRLINNIADASQHQHFKLPYSSLFVRRNRSTSCHRNEN